MKQRYQQRNLQSSYLEKLCNSAEHEHPENELPTGNGFEFRQCSEEDVRKILSKIPNNKADGIDGIPMKAIKLGIEILLSPITYLINKLIMHGFPKQLKQSIVMPIYKKGPADKTENYRPIAIVPAISKLAERVIANQLNTYLSENNLITNSQHGFRSNHSTNTALLHLTEDVRQMLDRGLAVGLIALDLSKAFDTINHKILINKLKALNLGHGVISFFSNYLTNRTFVVKVNNQMSKLYRTSMGVPQGSVLGPLLFSLYMNNLPNVIKESRTVMYADDTTLYFGSKFPSNIQISLGTDIEILEQWFATNKLRLNAKKTEFMIIANNRVREHYKDIKIKVDGNMLNEKQNIKILGVTISNDLTWDTHVNQLTRNLKFCFGSFSRACKYLTLDTKKLLYNASIASRLNYCDMVWDSCTINTKNKLQTIQNRCARRIYNCQPGTSAPPLLKELGWLTLDKKRKLHKCVLMHRLLQGNGPDTLTHNLNQYKSVKTKSTRAQTNDELSLPYHKTDYISKSFTYETAKLWNLIPLSLRQVKNSKTFKEKLNKFLLTQ